MTKIEKASKDTVGRKGNVSLNKTDPVAVPPQNLHIDPKGASSFRAVSYTHLTLPTTPYV